MVYKLIVSREAHQDIDEIVRYIALELKNPQAASNFLNDVDTSYENVKENPYMYSLCNDNRLKKEGYRKIVIKNYLIIYRIEDKEKNVFIVRTFYGGRNYTELI